MKQETFYCLVLSESQARFLATSKYGIDRMKALVSLIEMAATTEKDFKIKGFSTIVHVGQVAISEVELSHLWNCTRKTVAKVLERMSQMGLLSTVKTNRTSIHTLLCVSAWQVDGVQVRNPFYVPMKERGADDATRTDAKKRPTHLFLSPKWQQRRTTLLMLMFTPKMRRQESGITRMALNCWMSFPDH